MDNVYFVQIRPCNILSWNTRDISSTIIIHEVALDRALLNSDSDLIAGSNSRMADFAGLWHRFWSFISRSSFSLRDVEHLVIYCVVCL